MPYLQHCRTSTFIVEIEPLILHGICNQQLDIEPFMLHGICRTIEMIFAACWNCNQVFSFQYCETSTFPYWTVDAVLWDFNLLLQAMVEALWNLHWVSDSLTSSFTFLGLIIFTLKQRNQQDQNKNEMQQNRNNWRGHEGRALRLPQGKQRQLLSSFGHFLLSWLFLLHLRRLLFLLFFLFRCLCCLVVLVVVVVVRVKSQEQGNKQNKTLSRWRRKTNKWQNQKTPKNKHMETTGKQRHWKTQNIEKQNRATEKYTNKTTEKQKNRESRKG